MEILEEYNSFNYLKQTTFPCYMKKKNVILLIKNKDTFLNPKLKIEKKKLIKIETNFK